VAANVKAKSEIVAKLVFMARKERLNYDAFQYVCREARKKLGLRRPKRGRTLPKLLSESDLKAYFRAIQECGDLEHDFMLKFPFFTSIRVSG
jgi:integrase/recombinase XerD